MWFHESAQSSGREVNQLVKKIYYDMKVASRRCLRGRRFFLLVGLVPGGGTRHRWNYKSGVRCPGDLFS